MYGDNGQLRLRSGAGVGRFVIGLADEVKIIDSPALVAYIKAFVNNYLNKS